MDRFGVSTQRLLASAVGGLAVSGAGAAAGATFVHTSCTTAKRGDYPFRSARHRHSGGDLLFYALTSVVVFRSLGGRLRSLAPSDLFRSGGFARDSLPGEYKVFANDAQRAQLQQMGSRHGCHSCGRRRKIALEWRRTGGGSGLRLWPRGKWRVGVQFHGDHVPPNFLSNSATTKQRLFPQCSDCSGKQVRCCSLLPSSLPPTLARTGASRSFGEADAGDASLVTAIAPVAARARALAGLQPGGLSSA
jgi:hypothetical protein